MKFDAQFNDFYKHQFALVAAINNGEKQFVYIDSDGTFSEWVFVVIENETGVIYGTQCGGTACEQRYVEGFVIPCGGFLFSDDKGFVNSDILTSPFHTSNNCVWNRSGEALSESKLDEIAEIVRQIPIWHYTNIDDCTRDHLELDLDRTHEICEAWIPVKTKFGNGVLLWNNCD